MEPGGAPGSIISSPKSLQAQRSTTTHLIGDYRNQRTDNCKHSLQRPLSVPSTEADTPKQVVNNDALVNTAAN